MGGGEIISNIDGVDIVSLDALTVQLSEKNPGEDINIVTDKGEYDFVLGENPENASKAYMGLGLDQKNGIKKDVVAKYGSFFPGLIFVFIELFQWLFMLTLGIGLFNLLPLGIVDGGRMLQIALCKVMDEKRANVIWRNISLAFFLIVLFNVFFPLIRGIIS